MYKYEWFNYYKKNKDGILKIIIIMIIIIIIIIIVIIIIRAKDYYENDKERLRK